jgi:serine/threonine protein phosphatase 1
LGAQTDEAVFWKKYEKPKAYAPGKVVICGHTSRKNGKIADFGHTICIDTYAYGGMWLSCLNVETKEFIQANDKGEVVTGKL